MYIWIHHLSPFALHFTPDFGIRWYGLSYLMGFFCSFLLNRWLSRNQKSLLPESLIMDAVSYGAFGTLIGGRLGYCLFYSPNLFMEFTSSPPFWGVLAVNEGGMASHGGMIGIVVGLYLFSRKYKIPFLHMVDLATFSGSIGVFFGRLANFINGELVGRIASQKAFFAVKFPSDIFSFPHSSEGMTSLNKFTDLVKEISISSEEWQKIMQDAMHGMKGPLNHILHQIVNEIQNGNEILRLKLGPFLEARHPSQLYAAFLEGIVVFIVLFIYWRKPRKMGSITGLFGITYALMRILSEQFRMPDAHIGYELLGLTRGQWLSVGLLTLSSMLFVYFNKRKKQKVLGGWQS